MTYEYLCTACEHVWEAEQSISEAPLKVCPRCNAEAAKRQVSGGAGFILKGGGWYADLYGSATKKTSDSPGDSSSAGDSKKSAETKSTEAPAASKDSSKSASGTDGATKGSGSSSGSKGSTDSSAA